MNDIRERIRHQASRDKIMTADEVYFFTVLRLMPSFLAICRWVNPFFLSTNISKTVSLIFAKFMPRIQGKVKTLAKIQVS